MAPSFLDRMRAKGDQIAKASKLAEELDRLDALLAKQEREVQRAFADYVADMKNPRTVKEIADLLERGDVEGALRIVDSYVTRLGSVIPRIFQNAAAAEIAAIAGQFARIAPRVSVSFDPTDPVAADMMRRATLEFIREFTDKQREATRTAMIGGMLRGASTPEMARIFRDSIGLTATQNRAVERYRALLEKGSLEALNRELRDRRYDPSVRRASKTGTPIAQDKIDAMVERYRARYLTYRAQTIAETEAVRTTSAARDEAFRQAAVESGLDFSLVDEIWNSTRDDRTRDTHRAMNRQVRPYGVAFDSPSGAQLRYPGDPAAPAAETIRCRCHKTRRIRKEGEPFGTALP